MEIRVLGPIEAVVDGTVVPLGGPKPATLLAMLAIEAGSVVSVDRIAGALWWDRPPANVRSSLHTHVSALRRTLGTSTVARSGNGYLLPAGHATVDLHHATDLWKSGRALIANGDHEGAIAKLGEALALRRGRALGGARGEWADTERARIAESWLSIQEDLLDVALSRGQEAMSTAELVALVDEHPLRERLRGQLMRTFVLVGRQADALVCYQAGRRLLDKELGVEPGPELKSIHQRILSGEAPGTASDQVPTPSTAITPRQLPPDIADFTGRTEELARLGAGGRPVIAIAGKPGSGKSTLAVHVGHFRRGEFIDGELYVDLLGTHPAPLQPGDVLARFLQAMGVADQAVPDSADERVALYRSLTADRRLLVVLDNAADERQVRPLIPSGSACVCLITGRVRLSGLAGAEHVELRELAEPDALTLLSHLIGDRRMTAEPGPAAHLVRLCGYLPLAIRVAGARLASRPDRRLGKMIERLREQRRLLNELAVGDLEVRGSLNLSYRALDDAEQTALRRLGWLGTPEFPAWLVAVLLDSTADAAEDIAERLVLAQLMDAIGEDDTGTIRYRLHDLTRVFAWERAEAEESRADLVAAVERIARSWLTFMDSASDGTPVRLLRPPARDLPADIADQVPQTGLLEWFSNEQGVMVHVVERASELELSEVATQLAAAMCSSSFAINSQFTNWWRTHTAALAAARRAGDLSGQGLLLAGLGWLRSEQDRLSEGTDYYLQALEAYERVGDRRGTTVTQLMLCGAQRELGRLHASLTTVEQAWPELLSMGEPALLARAHHVRGAVLTELGRMPEALAGCENAVQTYRALDDEHGVALALRAVGIVHRAAGRLPQAAAACEQALSLLRPIGDHLMTAYGIQALAKVRIRQGMGEHVREPLDQALRTCNEMQDGFGQALILRTLGELELSSARPERAYSYLERSLRWWGALALPLWRARSQRDLATALSMLGKDREALRVYEEAHNVFTECDSREAREQRPAPLLGIHRC